MEIMASFGGVNRDKARVHAYFLCMYCEREECHVLVVKDMPIAIDVDSGWILFSDGDICPSCANKSQEGK